MQSDSAPLKRLLQSSKPGLTSVLTLHNYFLSCAEIKQTPKMIPFITWNYALSVCMRVGFWCQRIWFGSLGPGWFCQMTNQVQLCGFGARVSLLEFCLWWSSWSRLQYHQKCKAWRQNDKIPRHCVEFESWFVCWCVCLMVSYAASFPALPLGWRKNAILR